MKKMEISLTSGRVVTDDLPLQNAEGVPSDEYIACREAAGRDLPVIDIFPPVEGEE